MTAGSIYHAQKKRMGNYLVFYNVSHFLPYFCDPAKKERERTKGLSFPFDRCINPSAVAICCKSVKNIGKRSQGEGTATILKRLLT